MIKGLISKIGRGKLTICFFYLSFFFLFFSFLFGVEINLSANQKEEDLSSSIAATKIGKDYLIQIKKDFFHLITAPQKWQGPDIMNLAAIFGTGTVLFTLDQDIFNWMAEKRSKFSQDVSRMVTKAGEGAWLLGFCGILYGLGEVMKAPDWRRLSLLSTESLALTSIFVSSLKFLIGRARPHAWEGSQSFHPFSLSTRYTSFPSGHASAAFSVAATIASQSKKRTIKVTAYSVSTLVALARIHDEAHWASDVLVGSALGYFIGRAVVNLHRQEKEKFSYIIYPIKHGLAFNFSLALN